MNKNPIPDLGPIPGTSTPDTRTFEDPDFALPTDRETMIGALGRSEDSPNADSPTSVSSASQKKVEKASEEKNPEEKAENAQKETGETEQATITQGNTQQKEAHAKQGSVPQEGKASEKHNQPTEDATKNSAEDATKDPTKKQEPTKQDTAQNTDKQDSAKADDTQQDTKAEQTEGTQQDNSSEKRPQREEPATTTFASLTEDKTSSQLLAPAPIAPIIPDSVSSDALPPEQINLSPLPPKANKEANEKADEETETSTETADAAEDSLNQKDLGSSAKDSDTDEETKSTSPKGNILTADDALLQKLLQPWLVITVLLAFSALAAYGGVRLMRDSGINEENRAPEVTSVAPSFGPATTTRKHYDSQGEYIPHDENQEEEYN